MSKGLRAAILKVTRTDNETKYIAKVFRVNQALPWDLDGTVASRKLFSIIPDVTQGVTALTRVGDVISPVKLKVTVVYTWDTEFIGHYQLYVRQMLLTNKTIKTYDDWVTARVPPIPSEQQSLLLKDYNDTNTFPTGDTAVDMMNLYKPINTDAWTLHKGSKIFYMTKNDGRILNPDATTSTATVPALQQVQPYAGMTVVHKSFNVKLPKKFKYDTAAATQPTGFLPLFGAYMGLEGTQSIADSKAHYGLGPYDAQNVPTTPAVRITVRAELWFKDT